jgi:general secretion pathway protein J
MPQSDSSAGFTLLELLVAMAIFAIVGALALGGLNSVLGQQEIARRQLDRLNEVQRAVRILAADFTQLHPRVVRDQLGDREVPLASPCGVENLACFSRDGWSNPFFQATRGTMQRVHYRVEERQLIREYWTVMDRTLINEPRREVILKDVDSFELRFLGNSGDTEWQTQWPPVQEAGVQGVVLPAGVQIAMTLADWGEIVRTVEVQP